MIPNFAQLIQQRQQGQQQQPGGSFGHSAYDPFEEFAKWNEQDNAMHGALGASASTLPTMGRGWGVNPGMLAAVGAPTSLVQAADRTSQPGMAQGNAPAFLEQLRQMFGQQTHSRFPGIEKIDLNGLMGGKIGNAPMDASTMSPIDILKAMQGGAIFNQDPMNYVR